ncbi:hypothetical protein, partial [Salmonella sp. SAL4445]|uniref:hypothetical protein n=1 Tax=Salmonella sp. SAL4445 TaxID=3159900 RepID=UPI003978994E
KIPLQLGSIGRTMIGMRAPLMTTLKVFRKRHSGMETETTPKFKKLYSLIWKATTTAYQF